MKKTTYKMLKHLSVFRETPGMPSQNPLWKTLVHIIHNDSVRTSQKIHMNCTYKITVALVSSLAVCKVTSRLLKC